jgi:6-phosphogluconolactonase
MSKHFIYTAVAAGARSGVHSVVFDEARSRLERAQFAPLAGASYFVPSADWTRLYVAVSQSATFENDGEVAAFAVAPDGSLDFLNSQPAGGLSCCHLAVLDGLLYSANYRGGTVAEFELAADGSIARRRQLIRHAGRGPHPERQTDAHPHFVAPTPEGRFLCVVDLGCDSIFFYPRLPDGGITEGDFTQIQTPQPGAGPRHLVFNHAGTMVYVANELGNSVSVGAYKDGGIVFTQTISTLPEEFAGASTVAAIRLARDGSRLYCSNRGHDSVAVFGVRQDGGLEALGHTPSHGSGPRDFILLNGERNFAFTNEKSDNLAIAPVPLGAVDMSLTYRTRGATETLPGDDSCGSVRTLPLPSRPICVLERATC